MDALVIRIYAGWMSLRLWYGCTRNMDALGIDVIKIAVWMRSQYGCTPDGLKVAVWLYS